MLLLAFGSCSPLVLVLQAVPGQLCVQQRLSSVECVLIRSDSTRVSYKASTHDQVHSLSPSNSTGRQMVPPGQAQLQRMLRNATFAYCLVQVTMWYRPARLTPGMFRFRRGQTRVGAHSLMECALLLSCNFSCHVLLTLASSTYAQLICTRLWCRDTCTCVGPRLLWMHQQYTGRQDSVPQHRPTTSEPACPAF